MKITRTTTSLLATAALLALAAGPAAAQDETTLRVFMGGQQRPDVFEPLFDRFEERNPGINVELEVGGATSEAQQQYLTTVLTSKDDALDLILIDVVRPAQYAAAEWAAPLDQFMDEDMKKQVLSEYLPVYAEANQVSGQLYALPSFADAMFLYYRTDLLEKYGFEPPTTWAELMEQARAIQEGEGDPNLQGLSIQGAAIEGANCTFLVPYWAAGGELTDAEGNVEIDDEAALQAFNLWLDARQAGIIPQNVAEIRTDDTRLQFQGGNVVFAMLWSYGWAHFQGEESAVKDNVGVVPLPAFEGGEPATCIGGWQWSISNYSSHKEEAYELIRFLTSAEAGEWQAEQAAHLPVRTELYTNATVLEANPWFEDALAVEVTNFGNARVEDAVVGAGPQGAVVRLEQAEDVVPGERGGVERLALEGDERVAVIAAEPRLRAHPDEAAAVLQQRVQGSSCVTAGHLRRILVVVDPTSIAKLALLIEDEHVRCRGRTVRTRHRLLVPVIQVRKVEAPFGCTDLHLVKMIRQIRVAQLIEAQRTGIIRRNGDQLYASRSVVFRELYEAFLVGLRRRTVVGGEDEHQQLCIRIVCQRVHLAIDAL